MSIILKMTAPSAVASWPGSGAVARPRPMTGDCPPSAFENARGQFGATASATPVLNVPGTGGATPILAALPNLTNRPQTSTMHRQYRQRFRYWSPPN